MEPNHRRPLKWQHSLRSLLVDRLTVGNLDRWLKYGGEPNDADDLKNRVLHIIAAYTHLSGASDMVHHLAAANADVDAKNTVGKTPLLIACENQNLECMQALLEVGADVLIADSVDGETPLHVASRIGNEEFVRMLLPYYPSADITNKLGSSPLISACWGGKLGCMSALLDWGASIESDGLDGRALEIACFTHHTASVRLLLERGASSAPQENGITLLMQACRHAEKMPPRELLSLLLALPDTDVNALTRSDSTSVLDMAVTSGHTAMVRILLVAGADPNSAYAARSTTATNTMPMIIRSPLVVACRRRNPVMVRMLLESGASINNSEAAEALEDTMSGVQAAQPKPGVMVIVQLLLKAGVSPHSLRGHTSRNLARMWQRAEHELTAAYAEVANLQSLQTKAQELFVSIALEARRIRPQGGLGTKPEAKQVAAPRSADRVSGAVSVPDHKALAQRCDSLQSGAPAKYKEKPRIRGRKEKLQEAAPTRGAGAAVAGMAQSVGLSSSGGSVHYNGGQQTTLQEADSRCDRGAVKKARISVPEEVIELSSDSCSRIMVPTNIHVAQCKAAAPLVESAGRRSQLPSYALSPPPASKAELGLYNVEYELEYEDADDVVGHQSLLKWLLSSPTNEAGPAGDGIEQSPADKDEAGS